MKLPNGYGNISKLSGNRRRPWRVRRTVGWEADKTTGKLRQVYEVIGYYETRQLAMAALAGYNEHPFDIQKNKLSFSQVYDKWARRKFNKISNSNINGYRAAYASCERLQNMRFSEIKLTDLQYVIDNCNKNAPTLKKIKVLFNQLYDYAVADEIITPDRHISKNVKIPEGEKSIKHYRFTYAELDVIWRWAPNNEYVQLILMLIYSGVRPGELFDLKTADVDFDNRFFYVRKGKNGNATRRVPIHHRTFDFFKNWAQKNNTYLITNRSGNKLRFQTNHVSYTDVYWKPLLRDMGILNYTNEHGEYVEHLPDDTRHTFTTMWKEKKLDEAMRCKIQGHSGKGIGEIVYTHFDIEALKAELDML